MVVEEAVLNLTDFVLELPPQIVDRIGGLVTVLKAASIAVIAYIVYAVVNGVVRFREIKRMKSMEDKVNSIDRKLNALLKRKK
jgi:hypothetical protein